MTDVLTPNRPLTHRHYTTPLTLDTFTLPTREDFAEIIPLKPETDARLEKLAEGLILDVVSPRQFIGGLAAFYWAAYSGQAWAETNRLQARVAWLEYELDRSYFLLNNRGKTGWHWYAAQTDFLWRSAVI